MVFHSISSLVCKHPNVRVKIKSNKHTSFTSGSISDLLSTVASVLFSFPYTPTDSQFSAVANILKQPKKILNFSRSLSISVLSWNTLYELLAKFRMQWETSPLLKTGAHLVSWLKAHLFLLSFMCPLYFEISWCRIFKLNRADISHPAGGGVRLSSPGTFGQYWLISRKFTHFLAYFLQA